MTKPITTTSAADLRQRLSAWCATHSSNPLHLEMSIGGIALTVRGSTHLGVRIATCGALLALAPNTQTLEQAGRLALGSAALYDAGLAFDEASNSLLLSQTLHDPSPQTIYTALCALRAQTRGWKRTLATQAHREQSTARTQSALPSMPPSWAMRR